jgi:mannose-6-phosphate isomerase
MVKPYPLTFEPMLLEKVWGGRRLEELGKVLPAGRMIGESWELADLGATSVSGAGGGAARSLIASGPLKGRAVGEAVALWDPELVRWAEAAGKPGGFPLLIKFLDARENLSVQVHPGPEYAAAHPGCHLKTESWYVLAAEPGAVIYKGIRADVTREDFQKHIEAGTVVYDLEAVPAVVGECHTLPSGTCHALGAGVLVAEVQTPSDTTFRVFDWGRSGRALHVKEAMRCIEFGPAPAAVRGPVGGGAMHATLADNEFFRIVKWRLETKAHVAQAGPAQWEVVMAVGGRGNLEDSAGAFEDVALAPGTTVLLPPQVAQRYTLGPLRGQGAMEYLSIRVGGGAAAR